MTMTHFETLSVAAQLFAGLSHPRHHEHGDMAPQKARAALFADCIALVEQASKGLRAEGVPGSATVAFV
jgi:hypothetical protein